MTGYVTILAPPASTALTTLANAKLDLGETATTDDRLINLLIARASAVIANWIGHPLGLQTLQETFRHNYGQPYVNNPYPPSYGVQQGATTKSLLLTCVPVVAVTLVTEDGTTLTSGTDYEVESRTGLLWRLASGSQIGWTAQTVVVSYSAGYVLPQDTGTRSLPVDIEDVALTMVRSAYLNRGRDPAVILEVTEGVGRTGYTPTMLDSNSHMLDSLKPVLAPYRSLVI